MAEVDWREPLWLLLLLAAPLLAWLEARRRSTLRFSSVAPLAAARPSLRMRLVWLPPVLVAVGAGLLVIALAGPRSGDEVMRVHREGIAIGLVIDRSGSMDARDFDEDDASVSRLDAVKQIVRHFVLGGDDLPGRSDDLVGVVVFARFADAVCPLTLDHVNLGSILEDVEIAREAGEDGTAVGEGLALSVERLRRHPARSKVAILLTDGVSNAGAIDPLQAARLAADQGIRVYAIGAGRTGLAPVPVGMPGGRTVLRPMRVELDEATLRKIAEISGGRYFKASDAEALQEVYAEIDRLERSEIEEVRYLQHREHYAGFVQAALVALCLAAILSASWLRRLP